MERRYWVYGPFDIPRIADRSEVDRAWLKWFWDDVDARVSGLAMASGCYVFGMRAGKGATPWYVGQAKVSFKQECFTPHKLDHYNSVIGFWTGTPFLFLVARATPVRGNFKNRLGRREADWVENMLIRQCLVANKSLLNVSGTLFAKEVVVPGVFRPGSGRRSSEVKAFRRMLNLG